jgi:hypothetical protein
MAVKRFTKRNRKVSGKLSRKQRGGVYANQQGKAGPGRRLPGVGMNNTDFTIQFVKRRTNAADSRQQANSLQRQQTTQKMQTVTKFFQQQQNTPLQTRFVSALPNIFIKQGSNAAKYRQSRTNMRTARKGLNRNYYGVAKREGKQAGKVDKSIKRGFTRA